MSALWRNNSPQNVGRRTPFRLFAALCVLHCASFAVASPKLAPAKLKGQPVEDLAAPYNVQAVAGDKSVALEWVWAPPDISPQFLSFGFEVLRDDQVIAIVPQTAFTDTHVPIGTHTYRIRAKGGAKEMGKRIAHYSGLSEPAEITIKQMCSGPPTIRLKVEPTKRVYGSIPALRLHLAGDIAAPAGCTASHPVFHIDSGRSTERSGPLSLDAKGHFDEFVDALGPEDEYISGSASFAVSVTARTEAGDATSPVYRIDLEQENPYAPKQR